MQATKWSSAVPALSCFLPAFRLKTWPAFPESLKLIVPRNPPPKPSLLKTPLHLKPLLWLLLLQLKVRHPRWRCWGIMVAPVAAVAAMPQQALLQQAPCDHSDLNISATTQQ